MAVLPAKWELLKSLTCSSQHPGPKVPASFLASLLNGVWSPNSRHGRPTVHVPMIFVFLLILMQQPHRSGDKHQRPQVNWAQEFPSPVRTVAGCALRFTLVVSSPTPGSSVFLLKYSTHLWQSTLPLNPLGPACQSTCDNLHHGRSGAMSGFFASCCHLENKEVMTTKLTLSATRTT